MDEDERNAHQLPPPAPVSSEDKLHLSNIQFLAAVDCALALTTLIFNCRQLYLTVGGSPTNFELKDDAEISGDDASSFQDRLIVAAVASVCLTLTQLLLACLMMASSLDVFRYHLRRRTCWISGMWVCWSGVLLLVLIICAFSIKRFEDIGDKFYLFMLLAEIVFRVVIIHYTCFFYLCKARV